jgi:hypothetical protein
MEAGITDYVWGIDELIETGRSGSDGSLVVSQFRLVPLGCYAAFRGRTTTDPAWVLLYFRFSRNPHTKRIPTVIANVANGISKPILFVPPLQQDSCSNQGQSGKLQQG